MQRIRRPGLGGEASSGNDAQASLQVADNQALLRSMGVGNDAQTQHAQSTLLSEFQPDQVGLLDVELPLLDGLSSQELFGAPDHEVESDHAHDHGADHGAEPHDHSAHGPLEQIAMAGEDNPLRRQSDPLPAVQGEISRVVCGIRISGTGISPSALDAAERVVQALLGGNPTIAAEMASKNVRIVIVPAGTDVPDMPDFAGIEGFQVRDLQGDEDSLTEEERAERAATARRWRDTRGVGGHHNGGDIVVGFPEENLIDSDVRYDGYGENQNISIHELAHQVQLAGMSDDQKTELTALWEAAKAPGAGFADAYAASHVEEYFAQGTQYFFAASDYSGRFDSHSDIDRPEDGPTWLRANDPGLYAFLVGIYGEPSAGLARADAVQVATEGQGTPVVPMAAPRPASPAVS